MEIAGEPKRVRNRRRVREVPCQRKRRLGAFHGFSRPAGHQERNAAETIGAHPGVVPAINQHMIAMRVAVIKTFRFAAQPQGLRKITVEEQRHGKGGMADLQPVSGIVEVRSYVVQLGHQVARHLRLSGGIGRHPNTPKRNEQICQLPTCARQARGRGHKPAGFQARGSSSWPSGPARGRTRARAPVRRA